MRERAVAGVYRMVGVDGSRSEGEGGCKGVSQGVVEWSRGEGEGGCRGVSHGRD